MNEYDICYPNYDKCIVNISSTILRQLGFNSKYAPIKELSDILESVKAKRIVLLIVDGLGSYNLLNNKSDILNDNKVCDISSVFPPTTVAALTSIESESFPNEHCRLGWEIYCEHFGKRVTTFLSELPDKKIPYTPFWSRLKGVEFNAVTPFKEGADIQHHIKGLFRRIEELIISPVLGKQLIYAYYPKIDLLMHKYGTRNFRIQRLLNSISTCLARLREKMTNDTAIIITADHGQIDCNNKIYLDNTPLNSYFSAPPSVEPTAISFRIIKDKHKEFEKIFTENYGDSYKLYCKDEIMASGLFGNGRNNDKLQEFVGDFFAVSIGKDLLYWDKRIKNIKGVHAGLHRGEMTVPLIVLTKSTISLKALSNIY